MVPPIQVLGIASTYHRNKSTISTWLYHIVFIEMNEMVTDFGVFLCEDVYGPECREAGLRVR